MPRTTRLQSELDYLDSLIGRGIHPGLTRMRALLRSLGRPERDTPAILVAGTNGKGSTSAILSSILKEAGIRTGLYTSPHLVRIEERWRIDEQDVERSHLSAAIRLVRQASEQARVTPTHFEALTLIAFLLFRDCEISVLEVGMGGRLDATNVVRPRASLISRIDIDHVEFLGSTPAAIAREKAGVIHRGAMALTSNADPQVLAVFRRRAARFGSTVHQVLEETVAREVTCDEHGLRYRLESAAGSYRVVSPLVGRHQIENIALAVRTAEELGIEFPRIGRAAIERGISQVRWRGRLERLEVEDQRVVIDAAHNPAGARVLARWISANVPAPRTLVFGMLEDKDVERVSAILFPLFDRIVLTRPDSSRAADLSRLRACAEGSGARISERRDPARAFTLALELSDGAIVICGSIYLAGAAIEYFDRRRAHLAQASAPR